MSRLRIQASYLFLLLFGGWNLAQPTAIVRIVFDSRKEMSVRVRRGGFVLIYFYVRFLVPMSYIVRPVVSVPSSSSSSSVRPSVHPVVRPVVVVRPLFVRPVVSRGRRRHPLSVRPSRRPSRCRPSSVRPITSVRCRRPSCVRPFNHYLHNL